MSTSNEGYYLSGRIDSLATDGEETIVGFLTVYRSKADAEYAAKAQQNRPIGISAIDPGGGGGGGGGGGSIYLVTPEH